jgi:hypothetical protein
MAVTTLAALRVDQRVYQLLSEKFKLFEGVFGAPAKRM